MAKFLVPISNFEFWPVKNRSKSFKICHWVLLCLSCSCTVLDTVCSPAIPATVLVGAASTRRPSRLSAALHLADDLEASRAVPILLSPPQCTTSRARASSTERTLVRHPRRRPSFLAPRSSRTPFHLALHLLRLIPCLIELFPGRIGLAPSSRTRPPLPTSVKLRPELRPSRRRPPSGLLPRKIDPR